MNHLTLSPGALLSLLLATAYGAGFHLLFGGPIRKLLLYLFAAWMGFALGQWTGATLDLTVLDIGPVHAFAASLGAWLALFLTRWLVRDRNTPGVTRKKQL